MTTASAKVIIDAEDLASKKMADAARNVDRSIKSIKDTGQKAKASTEFVGVLARSLGGTQIGNYASQLANLTEKVSQFSEVSRAGSAAALAFKAGLVGVAVVITYQLSSALAQLAFNTKQAEKNLRDALSAGIDAMEGLRAAQSRAFSRAIEDIELLTNPKEQRSAREALLSGIRSEIRRVSEELTSAKTAIAEYESQWIKLDGVRAAEIESEKARVNALKGTLNQLEAQQQVLRDELSARKQIIGAIREAAELEKARADAKEQAYQKGIDEQKRVEEVRDREIARLKEQKILLEQGAEAARIFALEQQGLDTATAKRLASEQAALDEIRKKKEDADKASSAQTGVNAVESRLLTRGPSDNRLIRAAEKQVQLLQQVKERLPLSGGSSKFQVEIIKGGI